MATNLGLLHHVHSALRAQHLFHCDVEYILQDGQAVLIDEHTGRTMAGSDVSRKASIRRSKPKRGLDHSAGEPDPGLHHLPELLPPQYRKLAGMTGTADTEAYEFQQIYGLQVMVIPDQRRGQAHRSQRPGVPDSGRKIRSRDRRYRLRSLAKGAPSAGRHRLGRDLRTALGHAHQRPVLSTTY